MILAEIISPISFPKLGIRWDPPINFEIPFLKGFAINLYGLIIALGLILAVIYGLKRRKQFGLKENDILDGVLCIVPFAIICARLYYCAFEWDSYKTNPISILYIWKGGLAIYGGVIGAALGIVALCLIKKIRMGAVFDITALGFMIGQAVGRWGNFFNREAFGSYCNNFLAMRIEESHLSIPKKITAQFEANRAELLNQATAGGYEGFIQVHPTFLYESVWNLAGFVALHFLSKKRKYDGQIALAYVAWYGLGRTFIEGFRMDSLYWGSFRVSQLLAAATCFVAVALLVWQAFRYHDPKKLYAVEVADALEEEAALKAEAAAKSKERWNQITGKLFPKKGEKKAEAEADAAEEAAEEAEEVEETKEDTED